MRFALPVSLALLLLAPARATAADPVSVHGTVTEQPAHAPLENARVVLRTTADSTRVLATTTAKDGSFSFAHVPAGTYFVECSLVGHASRRTPAFRVGGAGVPVELPPLALKASALVLDEVEISSERVLFNHAIDRRVYNVDHDVLAGSSTASEVLQNIPSVQVDLDGNVSLRGSPDVAILVNGRKSPLMGAGRADLLQQLPAAAIEKIEVITNPSARFTPEGTSGIINIVMRKGAGAGTSGDVTGRVGAGGRHNENAAFTVHPGRFDLFGRYGYRYDVRNRFGTDSRTFAGTSAAASYREDDHVSMQPRVHIATAGLTWHATPRDALELSTEYFRRRPVRDERATLVTRDAVGSIRSELDRVQTGFEQESEASATTAFQHDFAKPDRQFRIEANVSGTPQTEPTHFADHSLVPVQPDAASDVVMRQDETQAHLAADYSDPVNAESKLEAGVAFDYDGQDIRSDADSVRAGTLAIVADPTRTYRFRLHQAIEAAYATYERAFGRFRALAGLRAEFATVSSDLVSGGTGFTDRYAGLYPTVHLGRAMGHGEVQLSYSRRVRRPESDDLNPFPEYTDPYNMDSGNPRLRPESIHSLELGYRLSGDHFTLSPSVYWRYKTDGFTRVTRALTDSTFLRTMTNLASDRSAGFEPVLTLSAGRAMQANLNANVFYEEIDASNLGFAGTRSVVSWSGAGSVNVTATPGTMFEVTANYRSARVTPQGDSRPSFVLNAGARRDLWRDRVTLTLAVSDLLRTQRQETNLDVQGTAQNVTTRRDSRIVYAGLTLHYGRAEKKKERAIQYEDAP